MGGEERPGIKALPLGRGELPEVGDSLARKLILLRDHCRADKASTAAKLRKAPQKYLCERTRGAIHTIMLDGVLWDKGGDHMIT